MLDAAGAQSHREPLPSKVAILSGINYVIITKREQSKICKECRDFCYLYLFIFCYDTLYLFVKLNLFT